MNTQKSTGLRDLLSFFLLAFALNWMLQLPRLMAVAGWISLSTGLSTMLGRVAVFTPAIAAFMLTAIRSGKSGVRTLWRCGWEVRFRKTWLLPALLLVPVSGVLIIGLLTVIGVSIPWEYSLSPTMLVPVALMIWMLGALPEEYGWRGYALDRLQAHLKPLPASLLLGVIWSTWHLPLHFIPGTTQAVIPFWEFSAQTIVLTVLYSWLHNETGGSVLIAGLFHASGNLTGAVIPYWTTGTGRWISFLLLLIPALLVVAFKFTRATSPVQAKVVHPLTD